MYVFVKKVNNKEIESGVAFIGFLSCAIAQSRIIALALICVINFENTRGFARPLFGHFDLRTIKK